MAEKKYPHAGHRQRLRDEFSEYSFENWNEIKILEFMLTYAIPRVDTHDIARNLINECGSLKGVIRAPQKILKSVDGMGDSAAIFIRAMGDFVDYCNSSRADGKQYLTPGTMENYFKTIFQKHRRECLYVVCLDARNAVIRKELISEGAFDASEIDVGRIVRIAVNSEAARIVLAHNHPGGSLEPSGVDVTATQIVRNALKLVGVVLYEHVIVTDEGARGFIDRIERMESKKNIQKYAVNPPSF